MLIIIYPLYKFVKIEFQYNNDMVKLMLKFAGFSCCPLCNHFLCILIYFG